MLEAGLELGVERVMMYDNIAIVVLSVVNLLQWFVIGILIRALLNSNKELRDILKNVWVVLTTLNVRLHGGGDEK